MFTDFKKEVRKNFERLVAVSGVLFYISIDRDKIVETYLSGFSEENRQEFNCSACKSFLRQFGGIVGIVDNKVISIWDDIDLPEYNGASSALSKYIHSQPITDVFLNDFAKCGVDRNVDKDSGVIWNHFYVELPAQFLVDKKNLDTVRANKRDNHSVLKRSLGTLRIDATETILELIAQNSLYRGQEQKGILTEFLKLQREYERLDSRLRDRYVWVKSTQVSEALTRIRNSAIGTLLINLSEGMELETAVTKFEQVVAPTNYKRPNSLVTEKMVNDAKQTIEGLGLLSSLDRRYATEADLNVNDILFTNEDVNGELDVFQSLAKDATINPRNLSKVEEISADKFVKDVLPQIKSMELLVENQHMSNFVSLITAKDLNSPSLFKWDNHFSWSYVDGLTDSMKERVKAAGGAVDGDLRFSIQWNEDGQSIIDLDAHAHEPNGTHIYYSSGYRKDRGNGRTAMTGQLDVDMISPRTIGVENITWADRAKMKDGIFKLRVHNFSGHRNFSGVRCEVEFDGEVHEFGYDKPFNQYIDVAEVTKKNGVFSIKSLIDSKSSILSKEKWGLKTNQFVKVNKMMFSPNHWEKAIGNRHYLFFLDGCISDETPRGFFNEFLKEELDKHRKVFEILGSKVKVEDSNNQLSGVGFSDTKRNHVILKVTGKFTRTLKVTF